MDFSGQRTPDTRGSRGRSELAPATNLSTLGGVDGSSVSACSGDPDPGGTSVFVTGDGGMELMVSLGTAVAGWSRVAREAADAVGIETRFIRLQHICCADFTIRYTDASSLTAFPPRRELKISVATILKTERFHRSVTLRNG